ncbi:MAG: hypothetical protein V4719_03940 [Planctomycetota bacterium]|jgi:hypothetical protein
MRHRQALVIIDFLDAHQTSRNAFAEQIYAQEWRRYPGVANAYCTTFLGDAPDEDLVAQTECDLLQAAEGAGINEWDAVCLLDDAVLVISESGRSRSATP